MNVDIEEAATAKEKDWIEFCGYTLKNGDVKSIFNSGAEFTLSHLWVSIKDRLPDNEDLVITGCWCTDYFKYLQQGWYCRECNEWHNTDGDDICVTHWMPIPELNV